MVIQLLKSDKGNKGNKGDKGDGGSGAKKSNGKSVSRMLLARKPARDRMNQLVERRQWDRMMELLAAVETAALVAATAAAGGRCLRCVPEELVAPDERDGGRTLLHAVCAGGRRLVGGLGGVGGGRKGGKQTKDGASSLLSGSSSSSSSLPSCLYPPVELIRLLARLSPHNVSRRDGTDFGRTPLHCAILYAPPLVVPEPTSAGCAIAASCLSKDDERNESSTSCFLLVGVSRALGDVDPRCALRKDRMGRTPLLFACQEIGRLLGRGNAGAACSDDMDDVYCDHNDDDDHDHDHNDNYDHDYDYYGCGGNNGDDERRLADRAAIEASSASTSKKAGSGNLRNFAAHHRVRIGEDSSSQHKRREIRASRHDERRIRQLVHFVVDVSSACPYCVDVRTLDCAVANHVPDDAVAALRKALATTTTTTTRATAATNTSSSSSSSSSSSVEKFAE